MFVRRRFSFDIGWTDEVELGEGGGRLRGPDETDVETDTMLTAGAAKNADYIWLKGAVQLTVHRS